MAPLTTAPGPMPPARRAASVVVAALLAAVAGLAFDGVFPLGALIPVVALAATVPTAVSSLLAGRLPLYGTIPVSVLAWFVAVSATLFKAEAWLGFVPGPAAVRSALIGVRDAGGWLLTTILPAAPDSRALVLVSFLVWAASTAGTEIALRSRAVLLPAVGALPVLAVAVVLGVAGEGSAVPYAAGFAALALLLALVRAARSTGAIVLGLPLLAGLVAASVVAAPALPMAGRPYDVRQLVQQPPPRTINGVSALDQVSAWLQNPHRELFTVATTSDANLRLAVLDSFDGVTWTSRAGFVPTGGRVPGRDGARRATGQAVRQTFTLQKLPGPWLPAADRPLLATGPGIVVDPATGMLAGTQAREGMTYQVSSGLRRHTTEELREATPAADPAALALPGGPDGRPPPQRARLGAIARKATAGARSPAQQAARLAAYLRRLAVNDVNAAPGHGYRSIEFFLTESKRGTTEQFAASFALLARSIGLPSRIMVGFRPGTAAEGGVRQVRGGDVLAWAEVEFRDIGWVPFYPTPSRTRAGGGGDVAEGAPKEAREIEQAINRESAQPQPTNKPAAAPTPRARPRAAGSPMAGLLPWAAVPAGVLAAYLLAVAVVPPVRRMLWRRAPSPAGRALGAWRATVSRLRGAGVHVSSKALTAGEVATVAQGTLGEAAREPLTALAELANLATFGGAPVEQAGADAAWRHYAAVDTLVRGKVGAMSRLGRRLSPGALVR